MNFKDFTAKQLESMSVLYESAPNYNTERRLEIRKIDKVKATSFTIDKLKDIEFSLSDGEEIGLNGVAGKVSICKLITNAEADKLKDDWKKGKDDKALRQAMREKVETMTIAQLKQMQNI